MEKQNMQTMAALLALSSMANSPHQTSDGSFIFSRPNYPTESYANHGFGKDRCGQYQRSQKDAEKLRKKKARKKASEKMRKMAKKK